MSPSEVTAVREKLMRRISHITNDRALQINLFYCDLTREEANKIQATLAARKKDVTKVTLSYDGWLSLYYHSGGLKGDKLTAFVDEMKLTVINLICHKIEWRGKPSTSVHEHEVATS